MSREYWVAAALIATSIVHEPVSAAASSSAEMSNLTITLYDLDLYDNVDPSITFSGQSWAFSYSYSSHPANSRMFSRSGSSPFGSTGISSSVGWANASAWASGTAPATLIGTNGVSVGTLLATGSSLGTTGTAPNDQSNYSAISAWNYDLSNGFTLSAKTQVVFSANTTTFAAVTTGFNPLWGPDSREFANSSVRIFLEGSGADGSGTRSLSDSVETSVTDKSNFDIASGTYLPAYAGNSGNIGISFDNQTANSMSGVFHAAVSVDGASLVQVVPEPETQALWLAGLAALGWIRRQRSVRRGSGDTAAAATR